MPTPEQIEIARQAAKALGLKELVPTVYQDVLQPAAKEVGQQLVTVAQTIRIALFPFETAVWGYERIKDYLSVKVAAKLANNPPEEIISPDPVIAGPVMVSMIFASEAPHLREMYANLLATAMHSSSVSKAHPSFVQIIQQLSSDEARILETIAKDFKAGEVIMDEIWLRKEERIPEVELGNMIIDKWRNMCHSHGIKDGSLAAAYCNNLIRLGILSDGSESESAVRDFGDADGLAGVITKTRNYLNLTDYGHLFLDVCVREN